MPGKLVSVGRDDESTTRFRGGGIPSTSGTAVPENWIHQ